MNMNMQLQLSLIPKKYRLALIVVLNLLILVGAYFWLIDPLMITKSRMRTELNTAQQELNKVLVAKNNIEKLRKEYAEVKANLQDMMRQMPEEKEVPNLLRQVSFVAGETNTKVKSFYPKDAQPRDFYSELPFEIKYSAPYHSIGYFFDGMRKMERIVHVTTFSLDAKEVGQKTVLEGSCVAKTYVLRKPSPKDSPKGKKEEKDAKIKK